MELDRVLAAALVPPRTIVLVGVRGAGKTTVGAAVARRFGRPFVDLDADVERITGRSAGAWIREAGWDAFREQEALALERALARPGIVLATGGGVVEHAGSRHLLAGSGLCVHLDVTPETAAARVVAAAGDRPAWPDTVDRLEEARTLWRRREVHLRACAAATVDANNTLDVVVAGVAEVCAREIERAAGEHSPTS